MIQLMRITVLQSSLYVNTLNKRVSISLSWNHKVPQLTTQPQNPNFLSQNKWRFSLQRAPNVVFFCQETELPGVSIDVAQQFSPFVTIPRPGQKLHFDDLMLTFRVDEDMVNYLEIFDWLMNMGFPDDFSGYPKLEEQGGPFSDGTLTILTSKNNPNISIRYRDMFPVSLSKLRFAIDDDDVQYHECDVTFKYQRFYIDKLNTA